VKIVTALLFCGLLCHVAPVQPAQANEALGMQDEAVSVRLRRADAESFPFKVIAGVTTRDQLLAVRKPRLRVALKNGAERWIFPVEPAMRGPTLVPPDAELILLLDASGVVRKLRLYEPPLPRLAVRNTPRPPVTSPP
jgi:hypothetical protein